MTIWNYITIYLIPGVAYTAFLEYYSTRYNLTAKELPGWSMKERFAHMIFWPISLITFIVMFLRELRK